MASSCGIEYRYITKNTQAASYLVRYNMSTPNKICKDGASKSSDDNVCEMNDMLHNMSTADNEDIVSVCANCGKEGSDVNNICNKCKMVKYCNAACKKKHRSKHKKACEKRMAELHDEKLFKQPPPEGDCPICFLHMPTLSTGSKYMSCCGKFICSGCIHAPVYDNRGNVVAEKCAFCRTPLPKSNGEVMERLKKRIDAGDARAIFNLGCEYRDGMYGLPQDYTKALELFHRAGELGSAEAYCEIGNAYYYGRDVEVDKQKAKCYYEIAAMRGNAMARHNLGLSEGRAGNHKRAYKHLMIAIGGGHADSLDTIKDMYSRGWATKDDYTKALQSYQTYLEEIKSKQRDEAAAVREDYRYY